MFDVLFGENLILAYLLISAFMLSSGLLHILYHLPIASYFTDQPGGRRVHQNQKPRIGGVGIFISIYVLLIFWLICCSESSNPFPTNLVFSLLICTPILFVIGVLDDTYLYNISNGAKFLGEILIAAILVFIMDIRLDSLYLFSGIELELGWLGYPLSMLWIVGVMNAINIIDGIDGLAGSITSICLLCLAGLYYLDGNIGAMFLCLLFVAAAFGFLTHNISPSKMFLGDTGSLFFGLVIGILSIDLLAHSNRDYSVFIAPQIIGFPIVDVSLAMIRRCLKAFLDGKKWYKSLYQMTIADNEHIHHRLLYRGLSHGQTCTVLTIYAATLCATAVLSTIAPLGIVLAIYGYAAIITAMYVVNLNFFDRIIAMVKIRFFKPNFSNLNHFPVAVIGADTILQHALDEYRQNTFKFEFFDREQIEDTAYSDYTLVVINNADYKDIYIDIELAAHLVDSFAVPVVIATDASKEAALSLPNAKRGVSFFMNKPLYIPHLLNALYPLALERVDNEVYQQVAERQTRLHLQRVMSEKDEQKKQTVVKHN